MSSRLDETAAGRHEYRHDSTDIGRFWIAIGVAVLGVLAYDLTIGSRGDDRAVGLIGAALTCLGAGLLFLERSRFVFDTRGQRIEWSRRHGLRRRHGQLRFDEIADVFAHSPIGDEGTPSRRVVLKLKDGSELPLTVGFAVDPQDAQLLLAQRLRALLIDQGRANRAGAAADDIDDNLRALVHAGRDMDAIRLLRETRRLDLLAAKQRIEELKRRG